MKLNLCIVGVSIVLSIQRITSHINMKINVDVMKKLSYSFGLALLECGDVAKAVKPMEIDIYNYWNMKYNLTNMSTGCLVICAMVKLELLDKKGNLKKENAKGYVKANGADDDMISKLGSVYTKCRELPLSTKQPCAVALEVSKCFRLGIHDLQWVPDISSLLTMNE